MPTTIRHAMRAALVALLVTIPLASGVGGDAGSGGDAGGTRSTALPLSGYGSYSGTLDHFDIDWYAVDEGADAPSCLQANVTPDRRAVTALSLETAGGSRTAVLLAPAGATTSFAIASTAFASSALAVGPATDTNTNTPYDFSIGAATVAAAVLPDPTQVGGPIVPGGCTQGDLLSVLNMVDEHTLELAAGDLVWYSLAAAGPVDLTLLAPDGSPAGPTIASDQLAGVFIETPGTYTLSARTTGLSLGAADYLLGVAVASEPPGSPCRPNCVEIS